MRWLNSEIMYNVYINLFLFYFSLFILIGLLFITYKFTDIGPKLLKLYRRFLLNKIIGNCYKALPQPSLYY